MSSGKDFPSIAFPPGAPFLLGPETAPVDAAKTRWFDDAPENIRRIAIATRAREEYEE